MPSMVEALRKPAKQKHRAVSECNQKSKKPGRLGCSGENERPGLSADAGRWPSEL